MFQGERVVVVENKSIPGEVGVTREANSEVFPRRSCVQIRAHGRAALSMNETRAALRSGISRWREKEKGREKSREGEERDTAREGVTDSRAPPACEPEVKPTHISD